MTPQNVILAEELQDYDSPISFCLNRMGKRIVGCSSQAIYNLFSVLKMLPPKDEPMDFLMTIRAGIKENIEPEQNANLERVLDFIANHDEIVDRCETGAYTKDLKAKEVLLKLKTHTALLTTTGVEALPNQAHLGCLFIENGRVYLDGTELTPELFCAYLFSSKKNCLWWFRR
jgi:hypothetical protein